MLHFEYRVEVGVETSAGLKCVLVEIGAQSAMTFGKIRMQVLHVNNLVSLSLVSKLVILS